MIEERERRVVEVSIPGTATSLIAYRASPGVVTIKLNRSGRCIFHCLIVDRGPSEARVNWLVVEHGSTTEVKGEHNGT